MANIEIRVELSEDKVWAFVKFLKLVRPEDYERRAADATEARQMFDTGIILKAALARAAVAPRRAIAEPERVPVATRSPVTTTFLDQLQRWRKNIDRDYGSLDQLHDRRTVEIMLEGCDLYIKSFETSVERLTGPEQTDLDEASVGDLMIANRIRLELRDWLPKHGAYRT